MQHQIQEATARRIEPGTLMPAFQLEDVFGNAVVSDQYAGSPLLLSFFRNGACALCNLRVHELIERYPAYRRQGLAVLVIFESPRESILQYVGKQDAPFPILADPHGALYARYGLENAEAKVAASLALPAVQEAVQEAAAHGFVLTPEEGSNFFRMPADFLIAPDQRIMEAHYADYIGDHLTFAAIEQYLDAWGCNGATGA